MADVEVLELELVRGMNSKITGHERFPMLLRVAKLTDEKILSPRSSRNSECDTECSATASRHRWCELRPLQPPKTAGTTLSSI